jgi:hypothetical protein
MVQEFLNSNSLKRTLSTLVRANFLRNKMKTYSTAMSVVHSSKPNSFRLSRTLLDDSVFVIALTIGLVFGMIQGKNLDKCTKFCAFYDKSILFSIPLSKLDCPVHV